MKKLLENASLNAKMLFALLLALLLAAGVFFAAYGVGNYFIDKVYMSSESVSARKAQIYTDFSVYVRQNNLAGSDYAGFSGKVNGLLIYPDGGTFTTTATNFNNGVAAFAEISYSEYRKLCHSPVGCVFLPCAGYYNGSYWNNGGTNGNYWSSSMSGSANAYRLNFNSSNIDPFSADTKTNLFPVRLLRE